MISRCLEIQDAAPRRGFVGWLLGFDPLHPDAAETYRAALGERRVGKLLAGLGSGWHVLHAIPVSTEDDIDHLVIGPPGVFTISTRSHPRQHVWVDGRTVDVDGLKTSYVVTAELKARLAEVALTRASGAPVVVTPVVVVVEPRRIRHGSVKPAVDVISVRDVVRHLRERPELLSPPLVAAIARMAEEVTTWQSFGIDPLATSDPVHRFDALRTEIDRARDHRTLWWTLGAALIALTGATAASGLIQ